MPKQPVLTFRELVHILKAHGFLFRRQAKGSHEIWFCPQSQRFVTIPHHSGKTIKKGTLHAIMKDSGLSKDVFRGR
ncbi:MAG: hypothetical protein UV63_C0033G0015 [Microgenomates group bacterium GW2011_GWC1_43_11]|uniref:YcfA family protein n=2 Tax=Candidatus Gottesmaniibacteriota TaxID=1752720 RepID=A0A0G1KX14_9BACT|nr:MAG: hypothetical protein UV63_C0033G0015 [Microgenomates group bacterium GW2011_GWC1_43_11]KKT38120.1 MAG: YcfA family protein [Candidatus Gottesmanbacteria bacterium GW2011_GWB1_44_11c]KKT60862.1 MAG: YcfA family protein [Candidatus Gottesmanbacteria bacterium GW2011_GWA1_44_24b]HCM82397.1 addiction module toxin, HicA family [Patescibacteria group bacterium]